MARQTQEEALQLQERLFSEALEIMTKKRLDYSGAADPYGNFRLSEPMAGVESWRGVLVRLGDKFSRIRYIMGRGGKAYVESEPLMDVFLDILNYTCILAGLCIEELGEQLQNEAKAR